MYAHTHAHVSEDMHDTQTGSRCASNGSQQCTIQATWEPALNIAPRLCVCVCQCQCVEQELCGLELQSGLSVCPVTQACPPVITVWSVTAHHFVSGQ